MRRFNKKVSKRTCLSHRYNRRHDGVLTVSSDKDRHELEEARLRKQWEKTVVKSTLPSPYTLSKEVFRG